MKRKKIALVAHDGMKLDLAEWVKINYKRLLNHKLVCTGTTGKLVEKTISENSEGKIDLEIEKLKSGPLGGDQQLGALIAEDEIDMVIFLCDPMTSQPHDVDVKALIRLSSVYNVPMALNLSTADYLISSELFDKDYIKSVKNYTSHIERTLLNN